MLQGAEQVRGSGLLFSRYQDGARPVRPVPGGWEVASGAKQRPRKFTTAQGLLTELTGHPTGRHWSLERYFGTGRHAPKLIGQADVFDLFPVTAPTTRITLLEPLAPAILAFSVPDAAISIPRTARRARPRVADLVVSGPVGIDLAGRGHEVRKLLFAGFGRKIFSAGYDPDDVLQEVYRGLLARNKGKCPWDPSISSFGHYVHMVCGCVLSNYHRKQRRVKQFEQSGMLGYEDGQYKYTDAASNTTVPAREAIEQGGAMLTEAPDDLVAFMLSQSRSPDVRLAISVMPYVTAGTPRKDIATTLDISMASVSRAVSHLRKAARAWKLALNH